MPDVLAAFSGCARVAAPRCAEIKLIFTGDFELVSEPVVFVSMSFYSKQAVISTVFHGSAKGLDALGLCRVVLNALEHMSTRARSRSSLCRARSHSSLCRVVLDHARADVESCSMHSTTFEAILNETKMTASIKKYRG